MNQDEQHLNLLSIFHYIVSGFAFLFSCIFIIYIVIGIIMLCGGFDGKEQPPEFFGLFFLIFGMAFITAGWTLAILIFINARKLKHRKSWMFCMVVAGIECIFSPFGTILGVFTIFVLMRDSVKELFAANKLKS
ncbi:MAG: hypothetical protein ACE14V_07650 [bacterium]